MGSSISRRYPGISPISTTPSGAWSRSSTVWRRGRGLPPVHLVTGRPTTLGELAALAVALAGGKASITEAPPRSFDVARFCGSPERARKLLGWTPRVGLRDGLERLLRDLRPEIGDFEHQEATS